MFAEELSGSATRKRQEENRARRRQLQKEKQKQAAKSNAATGVGMTAAAVAPDTSSTNDPVGAAPKEPLATAGIAPASVFAAAPPEIATAEGGGKSAAVANALQQRQLRQTVQLQQKGCIKIQSIMRSYLSNRHLSDHHSRLLSKRLSDLGKLRALLKKKNPDSPFVPPPATTTALVQQLIFLTRPLSKRRKVSSTDTGSSCETMAKHWDVQLQKNVGMDLISNLNDILEFTVIPGLQSSRDNDDNLNPLLPWLESAQGTYRLKAFVQICLQVATTKNSPLPCVSNIGTFLRLILGADKQYPLSKRSRDTILPRCGSWLLVDPATAAAMEAVAIEDFDPGATMDIIFLLRRFLLFTIGGSQPIPSTSASQRESCISTSERLHADVLFQLAVLITQSIPSQRVQLEARFLTEILSVPLVTWKVSSSSIAQLLAMHSSSTATSSCSQTVLIVSMVASFVQLNKEPISSGRIGLVLPVVGISMIKCPATNTQCLLANLIALGKVCPLLNGSDRSKIDFLSAATFYQLLATLLDVVPLGTYLSRDSAVEWVTDGKGHHTPIVLSPVILDQCKSLLVESFVRNLFQCATDQGVLRTESVLAAKNDKDLKHETDLREAAGAGTATAASMAAKEARVDRSRAWLSSKWANKVKKSVTGLLSSTKVDVNAQPNYRESGKGMLMETSAVSKKLASGAKDGSVKKAIEASKARPVVENRASVASPYDPALLFALCRTYAVVLARWGGGGKEDIVSRAEGRRNEIATSRPDPCAMAVLNVLCFGTDIVRTSWGLIQGDKTIATDVSSVTEKHKTSIRSMTARPSYDGHRRSDGKMASDAAVLLYIFVASLSHTLIVTDDAEIYEMDRPLPIHQLRRCVQLLKKLLCRACDLDGASSDKTTSPFGLALLSAASKVMRDLYDRSARRPLCVPKLWLVENLMVKEIQSCKTHGDYVSLLSTPVLRICPFLVSFKRRLKLFERIITTSRIEMQGVNDVNPFNSNPLKPGIPVQIMRGRVLEDGLATLNKLGRNLRQRINVQYLNEAGARESGIDAGGLFKEFWTDLCAIAFNPNYALFRVTEGKTSVMFQFSVLLLLTATSNSTFNSRPR